MESGWCGFGVKASWSIFTGVIPQGLGDGTFVLGFRV
jgi:hypothetical protein